MRTPCGRRSCHGLAWSNSNRIRVLHTRTRGDKKGPFVVVSGWITACSDKDIGYVVETWLVDVGGSSSRS